MRLAFLMLVAFPVLAQEQDVQRALIQRDQQSAEFAARLRGAPLMDLQRLENLSARQLLRVEKELPQELRPYERQKAANEQVLALPAPSVRTQAPARPRPLPTNMPSAVDVVPAQL
jgi:hypothetical protein